MCPTLISPATLCREGKRNATAYKNRSVATLDFSALTAAGAIRIGNLSSVTDFSTFTQVLPRLSEQTWSVTDCSYNPTYQQMLDGETGAESK